MNSNNKTLILVLLFIGAVVFYFITDDKNQRRASHIEAEKDADVEVSQNENTETQPKDVEKLNPITQTPKPTIAPQNAMAENSHNSVDLSGIDKDFRECLQAGAPWASNMKDNLKGFSALKTDLERVLGAKDAEAETYLEKTIQLPNGETRVVHLEVGTADSSSGNTMYWSKPDEEGILVPEDLPEDVDPESVEDFNKLISKGIVKKSSSTRNISFKNGVELTVVETDGEVSSISVQTEEHQSFCQLDPTKGYHCDCVY